MLADGTMANEVQLSHTLLQWPYLTDMSLVSPLVAIFVPSWCSTATHLFDSVITESIPWFYFNLVITDSQVRAGLDGTIKKLRSHLCSLCDHVAL